MHMYVQGKGKEKSYIMKTLKEIGSPDVTLLSDYILDNFGPMSHLKLQKLLYYCEGYHLAYFKKPLLKVDFEAWVHGPVCREVYDQFKGESVLYNDITFEKGYDTEEALKEVITSDQFTVIEDVLVELSTWTGLELENSTHKELPWIEARMGYAPSESCNVNISKKTMLRFYQDEING